MNNVADLVSDDCHELSVVHYIHESGVYADGTVGTCECVDLFSLIDLEVEVEPVDLDI